MMTIVAFYWPVLVVALVIGIASGVLAFRRRGPEAGE
jgi:hypothetical protein